jgi:hypothetical protein
MKGIFLILSSALVSISYIVYALAIIKGKAKPHRTTRLVFVITTSLVFASLLAQQNQVAVWLAGISASLSFLIFLLSFKFGMGGWSKSDIACLFIALAGIIAWQITENPLIGLYFAIGSDFTAMVPTLIKTYRFPETETWIFFFINVIAISLNLLAIKNFVFQEYLYPLYLLLANISMVILILRPKFLKSN